MYISAFIGSLSGTPNTTIIFSGEFDLQNITVEMDTAENMTKRAMELQYRILEFLGVDSVAVDTTGAEN